MSYIYSYLLIERGTHLYGFSFIIVGYRVYSTHERPNIINIRILTTVRPFVFNRGIQTADQS